MSLEKRIDLKDQHAEADSGDRNEQSLLAARMIQQAEGVSGNGDRETKRKEETGQPAHMNPLGNGVQTLVCIYMD